MATLYYSLSRKADKVTGRHEVLARFVVGSRINQRAKTNVFVPAEFWNAETQALKAPNWRLMNEDQQRTVEALNEYNARLQGLRTAVMDAFIQAGAGKKPIPADWLTSTIDRYNFPEKYEERPQFMYLSEAFSEYIDGQRLSTQRKRMAETVRRSLLRYEALIGTRLQLDTLTPDDLRSFDNYLRTESEIVAEHPELLQVCPETRKVVPRSDNTVINRVHILRAVISLAVRNGYTDNDPFLRFSIGTPVYGTPYYITIQERDRIYRTNLSRHPQLAIQRDIFVFQCVIGCRVSDLLKMTRENLVNGGIEYVPSKTKDERGDTVRVPLNSIAAEIVERYTDPGRAALLPFVSAQKYNQAIKRIFLAARLTRPVTILDPMTRQEVQRPLNEIASSHLARRTFVGNLYKQVKDPNLIAKLSGHVEGSKAFARYRDIDEDMRKDLVKLLEK